MFFCHPSARQFPTGSDLFSNFVRSFFQLSATKLAAVQIYLSCFTVQHCLVEPGWNAQGKLYAQIWQAL